jgi:Tol biopolymer transport system component
VLLAASAQNALSNSTASSGSQLGFVRNGSIFVASRDGTSQHLVLRGKGQVSYSEPAWSPNGRLAAVEHYSPDDESGSDTVIVVRPGRAELNVDGGTTGFDDAPTWAPDNKRLALIGLNYGEPRAGFLYVSSPGPPHWDAI